MSGCSVYRAPSVSVVGTAITETGDGLVIKGRFDLASNWNMRLPDFYRVEDNTETMGSTNFDRFRI